LGPATNAAAAAAAAVGMVAALGVAAMIAAGVEAMEVRGIIVQCYIDVWQQPKLPLHLYQLPLVLRIVSNLCSICSHSYIRATDWQPIAP
jgi:hypothetical protein